MYFIGANLWGRAEHVTSFTCPRGRDGAFWFAVHSFQHVRDFVLVAWHVPLSLLKFCKCYDSKYTVYDSKTAYDSKNVYDSKTAFDSKYTVYYSKTVYDSKTAYDSDCS